MKWTYGKTEHRREGREDKREKELRQNSVLEQAPDETTGHREHKKANLHL